MSQKVEKVHFWHIKCTSMKHILALLSWGQIWIVYELWAFTFDKMEVGHPVFYIQNHQIHLLYVFFHFNYFLFLNQKLCFKYVERSTENRKWFELKQQHVRNNLYFMSEQNQIWTTRANFTFTNETITLPRFLPQHYQIQLLCILPTNYFFLQIKNHASN